MIRSILYVKCLRPKSVSKLVKKFSFFIMIQRLYTLIKQKEDDWDMVIELLTENKDDLRYVCKQIVQKEGASIDCKII